MELREKVARAVCAILNGTPDDYDVWNTIGAADRARCYKIADAAIAEMWPVMREMCAGVVEHETRKHMLHAPDYQVARLCDIIRNLEQPK